MDSKKILEHLYHAKAALNHCIRGISDGVATEEQLKQWLQDAISFSISADKEISPPEPAIQNSGSDTSKGTDLPEIENRQFKGKQNTTADRIFKETDTATEDLYRRCAAFVIETGKASTSLLQRRFSIGYGRAALIIDLLEQRGIIATVPHGDTLTRKIVLYTARDIDKNGCLVNKGIGQEDIELYNKCLVLVQTERKASTSLLQRRLSISYARARMLMNMLETTGIIEPGSDNPSAPRKLVSPRIQ